MNNDEFIRALAQALTPLEDATDAEVRQIIYELAARIYALLLFELPEGQLERQLSWPQLRQRIIGLLGGVNDAIAQLLFSRIAGAEAVVTDPVAERYGVSVRPRPVTEALDNAMVLGASIPQLFTRPPDSDVSPFMLQLLRLLERSVMPLMMSDASTDAIGRRVIERRMRGGRAIPIGSRGTVANAWRERVKAITSAALWSVVTPAQLRASSMVDRATEEGWEWRAILDPRTCPVCRPLDGTRAREPEDFGEGPPPLHPFCRCIVVPLFI